MPIDRHGETVYYECSFTRRPTVVDLTVTVMRD